MHIMKLGASDFGKCKAEALREAGYHSRVGTIDTTRTINNVSALYAPVDDVEALKGYIQSELGVKRKIRSDAVLGCSVILDYPKDATADPVQYLEQMANSVLDYFKVPDNAVLYSAIHMDEHHPHMHLCFCPVKETEKGVKLSAKEIVNINALKGLHSFVQARMNALGFEGTVHDPNNPIKANKDFLEHKAERIEQARVDFNTDMVTIQDEVASRVEKLKKEKADFEEEKADFEHKYKFVSCLINLIKRLCNELNKNYQQEIEKAFGGYDNLLENTTEQERSDLGLEW